MNQISKVQNRVRSGGPVRASGDTAEEENPPASGSGSSQVIKLEAGREICDCAGAGAGMAETGCEAETGRAAQHGMLPP